MSVARDAERQVGARERIRVRRGDGAGTRSRPGRITCRRGRRGRAWLRSGRRLCRRARTERRDDAAHGNRSDESIFHESVVG